MNDLDYIEQALLHSEAKARRHLFAADARLRELLPEVYRLDGVPQPPDYHPEGDVLIHTLLAVDCLPERPPRQLAWAALLHDVGKAMTTREVKGRIRAYGHDRKGAEIAAALLARLGMEATVRGEVLWLVRHHMFALSWQVSRFEELSHRHWDFIGEPLFPLLLELMEIDARASGGRGDKLALVDFYRQAQRRRVAEGG